MNKELIKGIKSLVIESYNDVEVKPNSATVENLLEIAEFINETGAIDWPNHLKTGGKELYLAAAAKDLYIEIGIQNINKKYLELISEAAGEINLQIELYKTQAEEILFFIKSFS
ncbi:MAG: hypothetical protein A2Z35_06140 [Actinobacteria bacterium RBG_19FT_COMBO_36_27]|nr:MAG: hypothetical protein A2Z35_06140 [Actinobacteria bacterium RBG_19FT_COMBO_36_27]